MSDNQITVSESYLENLKQEIWVLEQQLLGREQIIKGLKAEIERLKIQHTMQLNKTVTDIFYHPSQNKGV